MVVHSDTPHHAQIQTPMGQLACACDPESGHRTDPIPAQWYALWFQLLDEPAAEPAMQNPGLCHPES